MLIGQPQKKIREISYFRVNLLPSLSVSVVPLIVQVLVLTLLESRATSGQFELVIVNDF